MTEKKQYKASQEEMINLDEYKFQPIKGFPMLNWRGKRPFTSTQYYPAQLKEIYGTEVDDWRNKIYWGDNLQVMSHLLKEFRGKVDLVYIDPPFDSKADYKKTIQLRSKQIQNDHNAFEDKQYNDIWSNDEYLQFMFDRLILIRELLSNSGSIYLHCDWHQGSYLKIICDEVFGANNFLNEITWLYKTGGASKDKWARKHDTLLFYAKSAGNHTFNPQKERSYMMHTYGFKKSDFKIDEETGLQYSMVYCRDVWELASVGSATSERVDYPTQKPEILLERIINASSNEGDLVLDCFMGSGTTQAAALKLGRKFIGADINLGAIQTATKRLIQEISNIKEQTNEHPLLTIENNNLLQERKYFEGLEVYNVNNYDVFRNPLEAKDLLLQVMEVSKLDQGRFFDGEKDGRLIKIMSTGRITTKADLNEIISGFDYKAFERRFANNPNSPVEKITLVCMGHEPDLAAVLENEVLPYKIDVEVVDILRDKQDLQFKRDSEAEIIIQDKRLIIDQFYPMNLLQKLSMQKEKVTDWRELVESVMVDWNYDGAVLQPETVDIPEKNELVKGKYKIPEAAGTIRVKITDLLSETMEMDLQYD